MSRPAFCAFTYVRCTYYSKYLTQTYEKCEVLVSATRILKTKNTFHFTVYM